MALLPHDPQTDYNDAACQQSLLTGTGAERLCGIDKSLHGLAATHYYSGNFESARRYAALGIQIWRSGDVESQIEELDEPAIACLCHEGLCAWHFGGISSCHGIENIRARGGVLCVPYFLTLKAEALHLADRTSEALEAMKEAETLVEASEERWWFAELYRLRGVFLTRLGADEAQIEEAFCESDQDREETKIDFLDETRGSNLRGASLPKGER
jgi:hypothetical protein